MLAYLTSIQSNMETIIILTAVLEVDPERSALVAHTANPPPPRVGDVWLLRPKAYLVQFCSVRQS